jgi:hypothetical protein
MGALERGRAAFARQAWADAFTELTAADQASPLEPEDLQRLATVARLIGRDDDGDGFGARAHNGYVDRGELTRAARCAFWLGMNLFARGEMAPASGWLGRAHRLVEESGEDCVEKGLLFAPAALQHLAQGDAATALGLFEQAAEIADRHRDPDLTALSRLGKGQALLQLGQVATGVSLLDEAMVAVTAGDVSPVPTGLVYCAVIGECMKIFDLRRAQEWTAALSHWSESQPDLVPSEASVSCIEPRSCSCMVPGPTPWQRRSGRVICRPGPVTSGCSAGPPTCRVSCTGWADSWWRPRRRTPVESTGVRAATGAGPTPAGPGTDRRSLGSDPPGPGRSAGSHRPAEAASRRRRDRTGRKRSRGRPQCRGRAVRVRHWT